jgi:hypothetical protein
MAVSAEDRLALNELVMRVMSDSKARADFAKNPSETINSLGLKFSRAAHDAVVANATRCAQLVSEIRPVEAEAAFFFFAAKSA